MLQAIAEPNQAAALELCLVKTAFNVSLARLFTSRISGRGRQLWTKSHASKIFSFKTLKQSRRAASLDPQLTILFGTKIRDEQSHRLWL